MTNLEGFDLFNVCLSERQIARITSVLAKRGNGASAEDKTILEMLSLAKPLISKGPKIVKFFQCVLTTAEGLMRACMGALDDAAQNGHLTDERLQMYREVFVAAQKYYFFALQLNAKDEKTMLADLTQQA